MGKVAFVFCKKQKLPSLFEKIDNLKKIPFKNLHKEKIPLIILDRNCFQKSSQFKITQYPDKIFFLYIEKDDKEIIKKINRLGFFDYINDSLSFEEISFKIKKAEEFLKLKKENQKLRKNLEEIRIKDPYLDCFNWQYFLENISQIIEKTKKQKSSLSLIIFDIDYFRQINQIYGWKFANYIIKKIIEIIKKLLPSQINIVRYREDAFIILLPFYSLKEAERVAENIKKYINNYKFRFKKITTKINISMGIINTKEDNLYNYQEIIIALEEALKNSKIKGGNKITLYQNLLRKKESFSEKTVDIETLRKRIQYLNKEINQTLLDMIYGFAKAIETQDLSTAHHVEYVAQIAKKIAKEMGLSPQQVNDVYHAAILHDLGKIGIAPKILLKKGRLNKKEKEIIKAHPWLGAEILRDIHILKGTIPAILYHHERWDGTGYPLGLKGEEIPLSARIVALADVYAALTSRRPYREAYSQKKAIQIIKKERGKAFDPRVVDTFLKIIKEK